MIQREDKDAERKPLKGEGKAFSSMDEAVYAYDMGHIEIHAPIKVRITVFDEDRVDEIEVDKDGNFIEPLKMRWWKRPSEGLCCTRQSRASSDQAQVYVQT
jgi:hypothetical protein